MQEFVRQAVHLGFGLGIAVMVLLMDHNLVISILAAGLFIGVVLVDLILRGSTVPVISRLVRVVDRSDPLPGRGALFFVVSALICVILFPAPVVVPALVALAVLDSVATLVGKKYGTRRIYNGKSCEGTLSGSAVTVIALLPFLTLPGALVVSAGAGILELVSPVDDNLVIPGSVCVLLVLFPMLL